MGEGATAKVFKAKLKDIEEYFVIKIINTKNFNSNYSKEDFIKEIKALIKLDSP